jgi:Flp pilus assembly protein TadG
MMEDMLAITRTEAPEKVRKVASAPRRVGARNRRDGERGQSAVEFALVVPIFLIVVFGMCSVGLLFNQYLELTEAVNIGGQQLALARGNLSDPCKTVSGYVEQAAPMLNSANMAFTFTINGTSYPFSKGAAPTCTAGASSASTGGYAVTVQVLYSCAGIYSFTFGNLAKFNPMPASSCNLPASITEISQ